MENFDDMKNYPTLCWWLKNRFLSEGRENCKTFWDRTRASSIVPFPTAFPWKWNCWSCRINYQHFVISMCSFSRSVSSSASFNATFITMLMILKSNGMGHDSSGIWKCLWEREREWIGVFINDVLHLHHNLQFTVTVYRARLEISRAFMKNEAETGRERGNGGKRRRKTFIGLMMKKVSLFCFTFFPSLPSFFRFFLPHFHATFSLHFHHFSIPRRRLLPFIFSFSTWTNFMKSDGMKQVKHKRTVVDVVASLSPKRWQLLLL